MPIADAFFEYIKTLAMFTILYTFVDLIMPNTSFKKYLNLIMGLILIVVVLTPVSKLLASDPNAITESVFASQNKLSSNILQNEKTYYDQKQKELVLQQYKDQLSNQIIMLISQKFQASVKKVDIVVNEDDTQASYGQMLSISISLSAAEVTVVKTGQAESELIQNTKKTISDFYKLDEANIYINMEK